MFARCELAAALNARGLKTVRGGVWHPASVGRLLRHARVAHGAPREITASPVRSISAAGELFA